MIQVIGIDADDTLWHNIHIFIDTQAKYTRLLEVYRDARGHDAEWIDKKLYDTEMRNLQHFGYGIKGFTLSMIETAIELSEGQIKGREIQEIIEFGKVMRDHPIDLLDHVEETLAKLHDIYELMVITKGDLFDQETKVARSGLGSYFKHVEVVSTKDAASYATVLRKYTIEPKSFLMVGNSLKSDVLPILELSGHAVHIPYRTTWEHEHVDKHTIDGKAYFELEHFGQLPELLAELSSGALKSTPEAPRYRSPTLSRGVSRPAPQPRSTPSMHESFISPIDSGRYGSEEMRQVFHDGARFQRFVEIEAALVRAQARYGVAPEDAAREVSRCAESRPVSIERVRDLEASNRHEVMSVIRVFADECGESGRYVHCGATSSDIIDTAIALQFKEALAILERKLCCLLGDLAGVAEQHKDTLMVGRTHGQHAVPITFGFKVAGWADEFLRGLERLGQMTERVLVGKMAGAVGSFAGLGPDGPRIQDAVMADLGLHAPAITTQIVARDRIAELVGWAALVAASIEALATDVRTLQRPEIAEVSEYFDEISQVGSSTMPHKRNPVLAENVCGLARIVRAQVVPALETVVSWDERDLTNSSAERFTIPQTCILLDEMLDKCSAIITGLTVHAERMKANLALSKDSNMAESMMLVLVSRGMTRRDAYNLARSAAATARGENRPLRDVLLAEPAVTELLSEDEIRRALDTSEYIGHCVPITEAIVKRCRAVLREHRFEWKGRR